MKTGRKPKGKEITENPNMKPKRKAGRPTKAEELAKIQAEIEEDGGKSANQMLADMRWAYQKMKGRKKLLELIKDDDKQFVFMVKELMKIESSLLTAQMRKEGDIQGGGQQNFFVVLKGLEDSPGVKGAVDKTIDLNQIQDALNPNAQRFEIEEKPREEKPEELISTTKFVEDE